QSATQDATTTQTGAALSSATQDRPRNSNVSVRIQSPGNGGSVSQSNNATSTANTTNTAPTTQSATQTGAGLSCGCTTGGSPVQAIGQTSIAGSTAEQIAPTNTNTPVRIGSAGDDGSVTQSNDATSRADATNAAP